MKILDQALKFMSKGALVLAVVQTLLKVVEFAKKELETLKEKE